MDGSRVSVIAAMLLFAAMTRAVSAAITISSWTPIYNGIQLATGTEDSPVEKVTTVRIDLTAPGIGFTVTPSSAASNPGFETVGQRTADFLVGSGAQVAINANFFTTVSDTAALPQNLFGLSINNGQIVSPINTSYPALTLSAANVAAITNTPTGFSTAGIQTAIAGSAIILQNGVAIDPGSSAAGAPETVNPRSAVGLSQDDRYLYLMAIDGRQTSSTGTTQIEEGNWLERFGAYTGLNLDGGGSTTLVESNNIGGAIELNSPSDSPRRYDGNNFGVFASPIPEPGCACGFIIVAAFAGRAHRRRRSA